VPKVLPEDLKPKRIGSMLKFLTGYAQEGDEFLDSIVTTANMNFFHTPDRK
jgi:hypothetical protein